MQKIGANSNHLLGTTNLRSVMGSLVCVPSTDICCMLDVIGEAHPLFSKGIYMYALFENYVKQQLNTSI